VEQLDELRHELARKEWVVDSLKRAEFKPQIVLSARSA
jgi:hypothetical protein